jgi:hypothetical protein
MEMHYQFAGGPKVEFALLSKIFPIITKKAPLTHARPQADWLPADHNYHNLYTGNLDFTAKDATNMTSHLLHEQHPN